MASSYVRHGLGKYPFRQVVQCRVCASVHRAKIERAWADGVPPGLILRRLPHGHGISRQSLSRHLNRGHLPVDRRLVSRRAEVRAEQRWDEVGRRCTVFAAEEAEVQAMVTRLVADRVARGELEIDTATALKAMALLGRWEADETEARRALGRAEVAAEEYGHALARLFDAMLAEGGEEFAYRVVARLRRSRHEVDVLELPPLERAWRWHRGWINGDDQMAGDARRSA